MSDSMGKEVETDFTPFHERSKDVGFNYPKMVEAFCYSHCGMTMSEFLEELTGIKGIKWVWNEEIFGKIND